MDSKKNKIPKQKNIPVIKPKKHVLEEPDENEDINSNPVGAGNPPPTKPTQPKK
jgi:hypothetical protein